MGLALALGLAHHVEHGVRGVVGWPFDDRFNPFTVSLVIYPVVVLGFLLTLRGLAGPIFWGAVALASALAVGIIHLTPFGPEPPASLFDQYESDVAAAGALAIVLAAVGVLVTAAAYAANIARRRARGAGQSPSEGGL